MARMNQQGLRTPNSRHNDAIVAAVAKLLRPLVRLLISRSVPFPFLSDLMKRLYVEVAEEIPVEGKKQTDSRIHLLTGVHRKDVHRLRGMRSSPQRPPGAASLGSQLLARWTTQPEYLDHQRQPLPLARVDAEAGAPSFESLVRSVNRDIRPRVVLDEWLRLGIAHVDEQDRVCLNMHAFVPAPGTEEIAYYFGRNVHDHLAAAVHNVLGEPHPFLERSVCYDGLSQESVQELKRTAEQRGMQVLQEINARALELQQRDSERKDATQRMNFGVYCFDEEEAGREEDEK
jgi:hypothetical protein